MMHYILHYYLLPPVYRSISLKQLKKNDVTILYVLEENVPTNSKIALFYLFIGLFQGQCTLINSQTVSEPELAQEASLHPLSPARYSKGNLKLQ